MRDKKVLKSVDLKYPEKLLKIKNFPEKLFCVGDERILNSKKSVAIVGSRECTEYGRKYARLFAQNLSSMGICIISGMALGIDTAAHYGAIYEKGSTIAVLAGGLKNIYPNENMWLYNLILKMGGCVITEHKDDEETLMSDFPKRNRIISGLADAVLIIEAKHRSGTKITATYAKQQGKKVYCIPSDLDKVTGVGANELLREGASLVMKPEQIVEDLYKNDEKEENLKILKHVPTSYKLIYEALFDGEMSTDELSMMLNMDIASINSTLTSMELDGYVEHTAGNVFRIYKK